MSENAELYAERSIDLYEKLQNAGLLAESAAWLHGGKAKRLLNTVLECLQRKGKVADELVSPDSIFIEDEGGLDARTAKKLGEYRPRLSEYGLNC